MATKQCGLKLYDSILVAYDGSKFSEAALAQAIDMARACRSKLYVMHVVDLNVEYMAMTPGLEEQLEAAARKLLKKAENKVKKAGLACEAIMGYDDQPHRPIVAEAKKHKVALIVVGTHGRTGLAKVLMGSVSQRIIGHAPCTVMVVPA
ncbi:MAG: universal stress protein [Thermodesulfobacteriota bacterium]